MATVTGIHHVSATASDPARCMEFYAGVLGMRLVKRTVNFDDPSGYHLYFGDESGAPGSLMTLFPMSRARAGRAGVGQVAVTSLAVVPEAIAAWVGRFIARGVEFERPRTGLDGETILAFRDPDGLMLQLVGHASAEGLPGAVEVEGVPSGHGIRGIHGVTLWVSSSQPTDAVLTGMLGLRPATDDGTVQRYVAGPGGATRVVDVRAVGGFVQGRDGAGTVHHVAFAVRTDAEQAAVRGAAMYEGLHPTLVQDRHYFRSVYFREPGGVLLEIATVEPGMSVDEPAGQLGSGLMLPPWLESSRAAIEQALPPLPPQRLPGERRPRSAFEEG
jgi:glyoxalase family protein